MLDAPPSANPVQPTLLDGSAALKFRCHRGVACWNACCSNIDITLTPYDVMRLKHRLDLDSGRFLAEYAVPFELEPGGMAGVKLRPVEGGTACRFMTAEGCSVYEDRPTSCRYYPLALLSMRKQDESTDRDAWALVVEPHCKGHDESRTLTVDAYRAEQGLREFDEGSRGWRQLVLKKKSSGPAIGAPSKRSRQLFFMACYDLDRFRNFVASEGFAALFDLPDSEMLAILDEDEALLEFGFRLMRQTLFGEMTIALNESAVAARTARVGERSARLEQEAADRRDVDDVDLDGEP